MKHIPNKTKYIKIRVTEDEYNQLKERATKFRGTFSSLIRAALKDFNDVRVKNKIAFIDEYIKYWKEHESELRHIGGNFNQSVRRVNELALIGILTKKDCENLLQEMIPIRDLIFEYIYNLERVSKQKLRLR